MLNDEMDDIDEALAFLDWKTLALSTLSAEVTSPKASLETTT